LAGVVGLVGVAVRGLGLVVQQQAEVAVVPEVLWRR
jgi:hypothetical protein